MKSETIAVHCGYEPETTTKAVAVPIYQTVAYAFDSAEHGAALFNLEVEGYRYGRISNPTTDVLERRVAALEGGVEALCVSTGQAALNYALLNVTELGCNIVSVPQLYGTTHTLFAHVFPRQGVSVRFAAGEVEDGIIERRLAGAGGERLDAALERGDALLQHDGGRVADAAVAVALDFEVEQRGAMVGAVERIGDGLIDRHGHGPGGRVGVVSAVDGDRLSLHRLTCIGLTAMGHRAR